MSASPGTAALSSSHARRPSLVAGLRALRRFRRHRLELLAELGAERSDIAELPLPGRRLFMVTGTELAREVLVQQADAFVKSAGLRRFSRPLLGDGLLTSEHDKHRRQRKIMSPGFQPGRIAATAAPVMVERAEAAQAGWKDGAELDVAGEMMRLTLDIAARTMFGAEVAGEAEMVGEVLTAAMEYAIDSVTALVPVPLAVPTPRNLRLRRLLGRLDRLVYRIVDQRAGREDEGDILSMLLAATDEDGTGMDRTQVRDEVVTLFMAGHETTANALAWAFHLLDRHPQVAAELRAETDRVLGGRPPAVGDLPRLALANQIFKETMRLYPPAYIVGRQAERELWLGEARIPRGAFVFVNIFGLHRRPDLFADPLAFSPGRFAAEGERALPRGAYIPFGGGPRICIGNHFAMMEGTLLLAHLAQRVELKGSGQPVAAEPLLTLRPSGGLPMTVRRRAG